MDEAFDLSRFRDVAAALNEGSKQPTVDTVHGVLRRLSGSRRSERRGRLRPGGASRLGIGELVLAAATRALNVSATTTADPPLEPRVCWGRLVPAEQARVGGRNPLRKRHTVSDR